MRTVVPFRIAVWSVCAVLPSAMKVIIHMEPLVCDTICGTDVLPQTYKTISNVSPSVSVWVIFLRMYFGVLHRLELF